MKDEMSLEQKSWMKRFFVIATIILIVVTASCVTFAIFSDDLRKESAITFGKIELGNNTSFAIDQKLENIVPGDTLTEEEFKFMKDSTSEPFFVRVKFAFSATQTFLQEEVAKEYLTKLRKGTQYNLAEYADDLHEAVWTQKEGNYIYLVKADNHNEFFPITRNNTFYTVSTKITLPFFTLDQAAEYAQRPSDCQFPTGVTKCEYKEKGGECVCLEPGKCCMREFYFNVAVQIVQSRNLEHLTFDEIVDMFETNFPEPSNQAYILFAPYDAEDENQQKEEFENA